jgi:hypothetical protein
VRSWDAWLAYQNDDTDKAVRIYEELFSEGYREDDEFALYAGLLADREEPCENFRPIFTPGAAITKRRWRFSTL